MARAGRWIAFGLVAAAFGPLWYELVAWIYSGVFSGMPPSTLFSLSPRHPQVLAACSLASLGLAALLRGRLARARGIELALVSGGFLLAGAALVPPLWWVIVLVGDLAGGSSGPQPGERLAAFVYTPALLAVSGLAWTALIVWAVWPLAAIEMWVLRRITSPRTEASGGADAAA